MTPGTAFKLVLLALKFVNWAIGEFERRRWMTEGRRRHLEETYAEGNKQLAAIATAQAAMRDKLAGDPTALRERDSDQRESE